MAIYDGIEWWKIPAVNQFVCFFKGNMSTEENNSINARGRQAILECEAGIRSFVAKLEGILQEDNCSTDKLEPEMKGTYGGLY